MPHLSISNSKWSQLAAVVFPFVLIGIVDVCAPIGKDEKLHPAYTAIQPAPDIVILGNSITRTAFDEISIATALSESGRDLSVYKYDLSASGPQIWYLVIKNVLLSGTSYPQTILLGSRAHLLFDNEYGIRNGSMYARKYLSEYSRPDEPVLEAKLSRDVTYHRTLNDYLSAYSRLYKHRENYQKYARSSILGILSRITAQAGVVMDMTNVAQRILDLSSAATGTEGIAPLLQESYSNSRGKEVFLTDVAANAASDAALRLDPSSIDQTFLPEIVEMCMEHDVKLIIVRHRIRNAELRTTRDAQYWLSILSYLSDHHPEVAAFDLQECVGFNNEYYYSGSHVTPRGQIILSKCLSEYLLTVLLN